MDLAAPFRSRTRMSPSTMSVGAGYPSKMGSGNVAIACREERMPSFENERLPRDSAARRIMPHLA
jgi:hypothetical protein